MYRLYDEYGSRLLELNVRSFLQARGKVNRGIRDTLRNEPDRFLAYNNGIVITVDDLETMLLEDGRPAIHRMKGMQIVNGGQTTASIHRTRKQDKIDISVQKRWPVKGCRRLPMVPSTSITSPGSAGPRQPRRM